MGYFNTTKEAVVDEAELKAVSQDSVVLRVFVKFQTPLTPSGVHNYCLRKGWLHSSTPLTSVRRSISSLTKEGVLRKTEYKQLGIFGKPEYYWRLA